MDEKHLYPPMTYQRPWTAEGDATVQLRRCREPLSSTTLLYHNGPPRSVEPLELEIAEELPDICSNHGRPAISRTPIRVLFYDTKQHPRFHRPSGIEPSRISPVSTIVVGKWPVCERCRQSGRSHRLVANLLLGVMAANLIALTIVIVLGWSGIVLGTVIRPLLLAFFPGTVPIGLCVWMWLVKRSSEPVTIRPIYDERFAFVQAHPNFRAGLDAQRGVATPKGPDARG